MLSNYMTGRDSNRGDCAQPCRWRYSLLEEKRPGEYFPVEQDNTGTYIMNSRDMCMIDHLDDLIDVVGIDAKHSNEDKIAPFYWWVETYGDRIGNFGGADVDAVCTYSRQELKEYMEEIIRKSLHRGGVAFGTGNSIPDYVPVDKYMYMVETVRELRGDFRYYDSMKQKFKEKEICDERREYGTNIFPPFCFIIFL